MSSIRRAELADVEALALLCGELGYPVDSADVAERLAELLEDDAQVVLVREEGARETGAGRPESAMASMSSAVGLVGFAHVAERRGLLAGPEAELCALVVAAERRDTGVGRALVAAAETWARERGLGVMRVRSRVERGEAHAFYERLGYALAKTQRVLRRELRASD